MSKVLVLLSFVTALAFGSLAIAHNCETVLGCQTQGGIR